MQQGAGCQDDACPGLARPGQEISRGSHLRLLWHRGSRHSVSSGLLAYNPKNLALNPETVIRHEFVDPVSPSQLRIPTRPDPAAVTGGMEGLGSTPDPEILK